MSGGSQVDPHPAMTGEAAFTAGFDAARVAVVRPTRDQIARCISRSFLGSDPYNAAADAVLALFGVAVSDSQETPT